MPKVAVIGVTGFTGALAANLLDRHPEFDLVAITARSENGRKLSDLYPRYRVGLEIEELDLDAAANLDAAVVAYPHGAAAETVAALRSRGVRVVDLSADFRIRDLDTYIEHYGEHPEADLISSAVYGLPEFYREDIAAADLVANPGCYPTATVLALAPLVSAGVIESVFVDAKSGVSGAGRKATETTHFVSVDENVHPYGVTKEELPYDLGTHRHAPEIDQELRQLGLESDVTFVPHLLPLDQGMLVSCYLSLNSALSDGDLQRIYRKAYEAERFIELAAKPPGVRDVRDSNICRIHFAADPGNKRAVVFGAIDNLWKGASSQAVQNLNVMFGYDEGLGIS